MISAGVSRCRDAVSEIYRQFRASLDRLSSDSAALDGVRAVRKARRNDGVALEAHVRRCFLDLVLDALGWNTESTERMVVEDTIRSVDCGGHRRRLDYHGKDRRHGRSLLVIEAKRPNLNLPVDGHPLESRFCDFANRVLRSEGALAGRLKMWRDILASLIDYIKGIAVKTGTSPQRIVVSNGDWFIVISDLDRLVADSRIIPSQLVVFADFRGVHYRFEQFHQLLAYGCLSNIFPPQPPSALIDFIPTSEEVVYTRVVDVSYTRHGYQQPLISICVGIYVLVPSHGWILFQKQYSDQFIILDSSFGAAIHKVAKIESRASELIAELGSRHRLRLASLHETEELLRRERYRPDLLDLGQAAGSSDPQLDYRLITGDEILFIVRDFPYDRCQFHDWSDCRRDGNAVGDSPIITPSFEDRSYFISGSPLHCAHSVIQIKRDRVCRLLGFEQHLCCRQCVFLEDCWPEVEEMPCQSS